MKGGGVKQALFDSRILATRGEWCLIEPGQGIGQGLVSGHKPLLLVKIPIFKTSHSLVHSLHFTLLHFNPTGKFVLMLLLLLLLLFIYIHTFCNLAFSIFSVDVFTDKT